MTMAPSEVAHRRAMFAALHKQSATVDFDQLCSDYLNMLAKQGHCIAADEVALENGLFLAALESEMGVAEYLAAEDPPGRSEDTQ